MINNVFAKLAQHRNQQITLAEIQPNSWPLGHDKVLSLFNGREITLLYQQRNSKQSRSTMPCSTVDINVPFPFIRLFNPQT
jgi:hypothetical protein